MMRPNFALDAPPETWDIGEETFPIETDFRVWIDIMERLRRVNLHPTDAEAEAEAVGQILAIGRLIFGEIPESVGLADILTLASEFSRGYPTAPKNPHTDEAAPATYSFSYDLSEIIVAIYDQHGIDLSYRCGHFHWWEFLLLFRTLAGDHYILNLMQARGYDGKDSELRRRREELALPDEWTAEQEAEYDEFEKQFEEDLSDGTEDRHEGGEGEGLH